MSRGALAGAACVALVATSARGARAQDDDGFFHRAQTGPAPTASSTGASADESHMGRLPPLVPTMAIEAIVRTGYDGWLLGSIGSNGANNVFGTGESIELDAGIRLASLTVLYAGWESVGYGVGTNSPYSQYPSATSGANVYMAGIRQGTHAGRLSFLFDGALGYLDMYQTASDNNNGSARVDFQSVFARAGFGASVRVNRFLAIEPLAALTVADLGYTATGSLQGQSIPKVSNEDGLALGFTLSLAGAFDLPLGGDNGPLWDAFRGPH